MNDESAAEGRVEVIHVYEHDSRKFEEEVNEALRRIVKNGGSVGDIKYAIDASTDQNRRGGFGALIIYEAAEA